MKLWMVKVNDAEYTSLDNVCIAVLNQSLAQVTAAQVIVGHLLNTGKTEGNGDLYERVSESDVDLGPQLMMTKDTYWKPRTYVRCWTNERGIWITEMKAYVEA